MTVHSYPNCEAGRDRRTRDSSELMEAVGRRVLREPAVAPAQSHDEGEKRKWQNSPPPKGRRYRHVRTPRGQGYAEPDDPEMPSFPVEVMAQGREGSEMA